MKTDLGKILSWMRGTDLVELAFKDGRGGFEFRLEGTESAPESKFPHSSLTTVSSPGVGFFRFASPGHPRKAEEGGSVAQGDCLGILDTGDKPIEVRADRGGRLVKVLVQDGSPVEYGQPLFFLAPR